MIRPGPLGGPRSFEAAKPAPGSDLGGRRPRPDLAAARAQATAMPSSTAVAPNMAKYGRWPSLGNLNGPQPEIIEGQPFYNAFERRWIE